MATVSSEGLRRGCDHDRTHGGVLGPPNRQHRTWRDSDHTLGDEGSREDSISNRQTIPTIMVANAKSTKRKALWSAAIAAFSMLLIAGAWAIVTMKWTPSDPTPDDTQADLTATAPTPASSCSITRPD